MDPYTRAEQVKRSLSFPKELENIPNEMLIVALTHKSARVSQQVKSATGHENYETYEFLGDAVLELVITDFIYFNRQATIKTPHAYTVLRTSVVNNKNLASVLGQLCELAISARPLDVKSCADVFEAIIGAIYIYLRVNAVPNIIDIIQDWLILELQLFDKVLSSRMVLRKIYQKYKWGTPQWTNIKKVGKSKRIVISIQCPTAIKCAQGKEYIGIGTASSMDMAKEQASTEAINVLMHMGYNP